MKAIAIILIQIFSCGVFSNPDQDNDGDVDLLDWALWEASFNEPYPTPAVPLEHCTGEDSQLCRAYKGLGRCGIEEGAWIVCWPWPQYLNEWVRFAGGPIAK